MPDVSEVSATTSVLRDLDLFAGLADEHYAWLASVTERRVLPDGTRLFLDETPATHFFVLVSGELAITKVVDGREELLTRHSNRPKASDTHDDKPTIAHRFTGELPLLTDGCYVATATTVGEATEVFAYRKADFFTMLAQLPGVAARLLPVLAWRIKSSEVQARSRATVTALGTLAAGLAHELNNPAAAVARAAEQLCPAIERLDAAAQVWFAGAEPTERAVLGESVAAAVAADPPATVDPMAMADDEDEIADWARDRGARQGDTLGVSLAAHGLTAAWLAERTGGIRPELLGPALDYASTVLEARLLTGELQTAGQRISAIVASTREYTNLDRAPQQWFTVTDGINATVTMLRPKLESIKVVRNFAPGLPQLLGYPTELNQVWTNLIDNAVDAMQGTGTLELCAHHEGGSVVVEISDTGSGIPEDVQARIFEPFYTTKDVGKGTGLGLHLAYRIVTQRHQGSLSVRSVPGDTRMTVRLPVNAKD